MLSYFNFIFNYTIKLEIKENYFRPEKYKTTLRKWKSYTKNSKKN